MRVFDRLSSPRVLVGIVSQSFDGMSVFRLKATYGRSAGEHRCSDGLGSQPEPKGRAIKAKRRRSTGPPLLGIMNVTCLSLVPGRAALPPPPLLGSTSWRERWCQYAWISGVGA